MDGARFLKRVGERGTVTMPMEVREVLDVEEGDLVEFEVLRVVRRRPGAAGSVPAKAETPLDG